MNAALADCRERTFPRQPENRPQGSFDRELPAETPAQEHKEHNSGPTK